MFFQVVQLLHPVFTCSFGYCRSPCVASPLVAFSRVGAFPPARAAFESLPRILPDASWHDPGAQALFSFGPPSRDILFAGVFPPVNTPLPSCCGPWRLTWGLCVVRERARAPLLTFAFDRALLQFRYATPAFEVLL